MRAVSVPRQFKADVQAIIAERHRNGGDFWATPDGRVYVGSPFSTIQCLSILSDLGMDPGHPVVRGASRLILDCWREDGRFHLAPGGSTYPCHTTGAAKALCRAGFARDRRLRRTFEYLLSTPHLDGGWRCNKFIFGRGPETECSNPGPTLDALDAFRFSEYLNTEPKLDKAVEFLLGHWETRKPLGPCHFGIGSLFMKVEYPLMRYNLFNYVYVLSFYDRAKDDPRFRQAHKALQAKLISGRMVVENPRREFAPLSICTKGLPSEAATLQYSTIVRNIHN